MSPKLQRVILCGTTATTAWRAGVTARLVERGLATDRIYNPQLPESMDYTLEHRRQENHVMHLPDTIVFIHFCPVTHADGEVTEWLGEIRMKEAGQYAFGEPHRTVIVFDPAAFRKGGRSQLTLQSMLEEMDLLLGEQNPYYPSLMRAADWVVDQLLA